MHRHQRPKGGPFTEGDRFVLCPARSTKETLVRALRPAGLPITTARGARHVRDGIRLFRGDGVRIVVGSNELGGTGFVGQGVEGVVEFLFGTRKQVSVAVECEAH